MYVILPLTKGHLSNKDSGLAEEMSLLEGDHCIGLVQVTFEKGSLFNKVKISQMLGNEAIILLITTLRSLPYVMQSRQTAEHQPRKTNLPINR